MKLRVESLVIIVFLIAALNVAVPFGIGSDANANDPSYSPLYDYRYNQVNEELGVLANGTSDNKLSYGSIKTIGLHPDSSAEGTACKLTIKSDESGAADTSNCIKQVGETTYETCAGWETCDSTCRSTCAASCGSTCSLDTCGSTCGDSCGSTCGGTCGSTCGSTCAASCGSTCSLDTCGSTCGDTCSSTCGSTCGDTCSSTCGSTCGSTCINTCRSTCGSTCVNTCRSTCGNTCANTCRSTCSSTCANTCRSTCAATCWTTCSPKCAPAPIAPAFKYANNTVKSLPTSAQNRLFPYDIQKYPPQSVYYQGTTIPWATFLRSFNGDQPLAWIDVIGGWGVSAKASQNTWVPEIFYVPTAGDLTLITTSPDGKTISKKFGSTTPGYKYLWFNAYQLGNFTEAFTIGYISSNSITLYGY